MVETNLNTEAELEPTCVCGTITYLQRIALPPGAIVEVQLQDVSCQDVAATILATQTIQLTGQQVPIPFQLSYSIAQINLQHRYAVQARILVNHQLWFTNTSTYWVITHGYPKEIEILVQSAK